MKNSFLEDELKYFFLRFYWDVCLFTLAKPIIMGGGGCGFYFAMTLTYNVSKSHYLCFKPKHIKLHDPTFYLNKLEIPKVDQCERGVMVSTQNCDIDMKRQWRKF